MYHSALSTSNSRPKMSVQNMIIFNSTQPGPVPCQPLYSSSACSNPSTSKFTLLRGANLYGSISMAYTMSETLEHTQRTSAALCIVLGFSGLWDESPSGCRVQQALHFWSLMFRSLKKISTGTVYSLFNLHEKKNLGYLGSALASDIFIYA